MRLKHTIKTALAVTTAAVVLLATTPTPTVAGWQDKYPTINFGVLTL